MTWQQNKKLAQLYKYLDEVNKSEQLETKSKQELIQINQAALQIMAEMNEEIGKLKRETTGSVFQKLKKEMWEHSELLAKSKARAIIKEELGKVIDEKIDSLNKELDGYLNEMIDKKIKEILKNKG